MKQTQEQLNHEINTIQSKLERQLNAIGHKNQQSKNTKMDN